MFGDGLCRPICWLSPGMEPPVSPAAGPFRSTSPCQRTRCGASAGELVAVSRAGEKQLIFLQKSGRKNLLSVQERALGSTRAVFKDLKEITVVPGALFVPASAA